MNAGQLQVLEALVEALSWHKTNVKVPRNVVDAIGIICLSNGIDQR